MADFNDEYYSKEDKRSDTKQVHVVDVIAIILCLVAAIGIWLFAVNSGKEPQKNDEETSKTETVASQTVLSIDEFAN